MATPRVVRFGGHTFDPATDGYQVGLGQGPSVQVDASVSGRAWTRPRLDALTPQTRTLELVAWKTDPAVTIEEYRRRLSRVFAPETGERLLVVERADGTQVQLLAWCSGIAYRGESEADARVTLETREIAWQAVAESTSSGPTVTASGNVRARARIVVPGTSGTPCTRRRYAVTDRCGRGVGGYPLLLSDSWSASARRTVVFQNGLLVPFRVAGDKLWTRVDLPPDGTTYVDVYSGSGVDNTVTADALDDGGLDLEASTNTSWHWYAVRAGRNPLAAAGAWRFGRTFAHPQERDYRFGVLVDSETTARLAAADPVMPESAHLIDDYDSVVCVTGVEIASVSISVAARARSHTEISDSREYTQEYVGQAEFWGAEVRVRRDYEISTGSGSAMLVARKPGAPTWEPVAARPVSKDQQWSGTLSASFALGERPVAIALRCQPGVVRRRGGNTSTFTAPDGDARSFTNWLTTGVVVELLLPIEVTLASGRTPLVALVDTVPARVRTGTLRNTTTGQWIELEEVYTDAVELVLDGEARQVSVASGPLYAREIRFSDAPRWIELEPGANSVSAPWPVAWRWRDRWLV
jgi:hypothetical protein